MMVSFNELNIIGLTGMSGAGKSLAASVFEAHNYRVVDCDRLARQTINNAKCAGAVKAAFPEAYVNDELCRVRMAGIVFSSYEKLKCYEKIVYPFITYSVIRFIRKYAEKGEVSFLLDAPTLYQSGADDFCRKIIAVVADKATCVKRITLRDNIGEADALMRLGSQPDARFYKENADYMVYNDGNTDSFRRSIMNILSEMTHDN